MKTHTFVVLVFCILACGMHAEAEELVAFEGTCRNVTAGADGHVKLVVSEENHRLTGAMSVTGWLGGGGDVTGTLNGARMQFTTYDTRSGITIEWQGEIKNGGVTGEYFTKSSTLIEKQVGEWSASWKGRQNDPKTSENVTKVLFKMYLEETLNAPVKTTKGDFISGADSLFRATHPAGKGVSVTVEGLEVDWNSDSSTKLLSDIHKFRATYVLYWEGIVTPTGWTRFRMAYNTKINAFTANEILQTTGTTIKEANDMAFGLGVILGKFAVDSLLNSK